MVEVGGVTETRFPSQAWFDRYREAINADDEYAAAAADWGTDFDGDMLFVTTDIPVDALDREALPPEARAELDEYVREGTGHALLGLAGGRCTAARLVADPGAVDVGFVLEGEYGAWKRLLRGEVGAVDGMMSGEFDLDGDLQKVLQYSEAATRLTDLAASVEAVFVDEAYA